MTKERPGGPIFCILRRVPSSKDHRAICPAYSGDGYFLPAGGGRDGLLEGYADGHADRIPDADLQAVF